MKLITESPFQESLRENIGYYKNGRRTGLNAIRVEIEDYKSAGLF